jgi:SEC-C motif domain protein
VDVLERAIDIYEELGKREEAAVLRKEAEALAKSNTIKFSNVPIKSEKVGRNDPCSCGSGKKYKKCCGK